MSEIADNTSLIHRIYEIALIPELWPNALDDLGEGTRLYGGTLFSMDAQRVVRQIIPEQYRDLMQIFLRDPFRGQLKSVFSKTGTGR
jgi:hypothetical protein